MPDTFGTAKKVSIIIPAINEEKLIRRVLSQFNSSIKSKFDLEVIVSDGGSKDSTLKIAKEYADRLILHKKDYQQNISQGRNEGAKNSLGDVLIFLNADTYVKDIEYVLNETLKQFLDKDVSAIACPVYIFPDEEKLSDKAFHFFYNNYAAMLNKFFMGMGRGECHIIKRERFFELEGYDEKLPAGEDYDLYKRLKKKGKLVFRRDFIVYESPRRYRKYGYARVFWDWTKNAIAITLTNKSISKKWEAVR
ncbi:MAG: glycosyltransferase [Ignavibacteria bacterium]